MLITTWYATSSSAPRESQAPIVTRTIEKESGAIQRHELGCMAHPIKPVLSNAQIGPGFEPLVSLPLGPVKVAITALTLVWPGCDLPFEASGCRSACEQPGKRSLPAAHAAVGRGNRSIFMSALCGRPFGFLLMAKYRPETRAMIADWCLVVPLLSAQYTF